MSIFTGLSSNERETATALPDTDQNPHELRPLGLAAEGSGGSAVAAPVENEHSRTTAPVRTAPAARVNANTVLNRIDGVLHRVLDNIRQGELPRVGFEMEDALTFHRAQARREVQLSSSDSRTSDRFCRSLVVMDTVQVLPVPLVSQQTNGHEFQSSSEDCYRLQENQMEQFSQTQRDLYYQVKSDLFPSQVVVSHGVNSNLLVG